MKKIFLNMQYKNILIFEMIYRFIVVILGSRIILSVVDGLLDVYGFSFLTLKNVGDFFTEPLTYPIILVAIVIIMILSDFEFATLYIGISRAIVGENVSMSKMISDGLKRLPHTLKPRNIVYGLLQMGILLVWQSFPLYRVAGMSSKTRDIIDLVSTNKTAVVLGILLAVIAAVVILRYMHLPSFVILGKLDFKDAVKNEKGFYKEKMWFRAIVRYGAITLMMAGAFYICYYVIYGLFSGLIILFATKKYEIVLIDATRRFINMLIAFVFSVLIPMLYTGIAVYNFYEKYPELASESSEEAHYKKENIAWTKRLAIGMFIALFVGSVITITDVVWNGNFGTISSFGEISITAHRGFSEEAPENTLPAIEHAIDSMADFAEIDIRQTKDKEIVVMHDENIVRTTGVDGIVSDMTYDELYRIDAGANFKREYAGTHIPTFREVLQLCKGKINLNVEVKTSSKDEHFVDDILALVEEFGMEDQIIFCSNDYSCMKEIKKHDKKYYTGYIIPAGYGDYFNDPNVDFFSINISYLTPEKVNKAHEYGKCVYAWTINDKRVMEKVKILGVDGIITDKPTLAREILYGD